MQVATMPRMNRLDAREKYAEYMKAVKERHSAEYEALKNGYRELMRGKQVIDLIASLKQAGVDHLGRPRLAVCRADARLCWFSFNNPRGPKYAFAHQSISRWTSKLPAKAITVPTDTFSTTPDQRDRVWRAVVPSIPPSLRPSGDLSRYSILWEAEWEGIPVDPMLLKHLGKNLYVVLAAWDLTPLERAVLADR